jgi:hypothetical protein
MTKFNQCKLEIKFEFGSCNSKYFTVVIDDNKSIKTITPTDNFYCTDIELPTQVKLAFSGKTDGDTLVDENNNIVEDMYVKIAAIWLDKFPLSVKYIHQQIQIVTTSGETHTTSYIGFNGTVVLDYSEDNVFSQVLSLNN